MSDCERLMDWAGRLRQIYQPLKGFESKTPPKRVEGFERILGTIIEHCGEVEGKRFLDIGANVGYFCFKLTDLGAETISLERDVKRSTLSECVARREGYEEGNPLFIREDAPTWVLENKPEVDYVLLLNTFHHILWQDEEAGWAMFNWLIENSGGVFVMMRNSLKGWKLCDSAKDIPDAVVAKSSAENYVAYPPVHGRMIYFFSTQPISA